MFQLMSPTGFPGLNLVEPPVAHIVEIASKIYRLRKGNRDLII